MSVLTDQTDRNKTAGWIGGVSSVFAFKNEGINLAKG
jgi:hypothetical protein